VGKDPNKLSANAKNRTKIYWGFPTLSVLYKSCATFLLNPFFTGHHR